MEKSCDEMEAMLLSWGLGKAHVKAFVDAHVTTASLPFLTDDSILTLLPQPGPRDLFKHYFERFKSLRVLPQLPPVTPETPSTPTSTPSTSTSTPSTSTSTPSTSRALPTSDQPPPRKRPRHEECILQQIQSEPCINALHEYLKESIAGVTVLAFYKSKSFLDDYTRDLLSQETVYKELKLDFNRSLSREDFSSIADAIVQLFPNECKLTWYDEVKKNGRTVIEGKLRFKYYSVRRGLGNANLIFYKTPKKSSTVINSDSEDDTDVEENSDLQLLFSEETDEAWANIEKAWEATLKARQKVYQKTTDLHQYMTKFPCLDKPLGWKLLAWDGEQVENTLKNHSECWKACVPFMLSSIQQEHPTFTCSNVSDGCEFLSVILKLPFLFRVRNITKSNKAPKNGKCWRPSRQEIADSLCLLVPEISAIQEKLKARKKNLEKYHFPNLPVAVVVGNLAEIRQCFIIIEDYRWEVASPIEAFFGVFKIYFGANVSYPVESRHIWLFLQQTVFKLTTPQDYSHDKGLRSFLSARLKDFANFKP